MKVLTLTLSAVFATLAARPGVADNLLKNSSFEEPKISGTVDAMKGGSPVFSKEENSWTVFKSRDLTGKVSVGLTESVTRTGKQALFVQFDGAISTRGAFLMSDLIPIKAGEPYRVSLWGRTDAKRPLTLDQGRPYLMLEVEFYPEDQATRIDETLVRTQMIPGMAERLLFLSSKWSEYSAKFFAPEGAEFMKITFRWESPRRDDPADGIIYFDDAAIEGPAGRLVPSADPPPAADEPAEASPAKPVPPVK